MGALLPGWDPIARKVYHKQNINYIYILLHFLGGLGLIWTYFQSLLPGNKLSFQALCLCISNILCCQLQEQFIIIAYSARLRTYFCLTMDLINICYKSNNSRFLKIIIYWIRLTQLGPGDWMLFVSSPFSGCMIQIDYDMLKLYYESQIKVSRII